MVGTGPQGNGEDSGGAQKEQAVPRAWPHEELVELPRGLPQTGWGHSLLVPRQGLRDLPSAKWQCQARESPQVWLCVAPGATCPAQHSCSRPLTGHAATGSKERKTKETAQAWGPVAREAEQGEHKSKASLNHLARPQ